ncbi:MAG: sigma-70 family RNA polymerase sigma factor [Candidatus Rokubacteria bacterium]|nr:sigma-70 family RNA polymerase sigma factor [Candidatus Rokubacteria bacterium]
MDLDDQALLERCRAGDVAAFEPLVEKYRQRVYRLAYHVLRDGEEAWDVAQEAFIRAWQALPTFRGQSAFYTWLFRIAMNVAADRARQRGAQGRAFGTERVADEDWERTLVDQGGGPDEAAARGEQRERIARALATLSEPHRAIIMLSDIEGLTYREIAEVLHVPMGTVMSRLHNARKRLREALGPLLALVLVLLALLATAAEAQQVVRFGTRVLLASDAPPPSAQRLAPEAPDARLEAFIPRLRQLFRYREYTSLERHRAEVPVGSTQRWPVPGDRQLDVTPEAISGSVVRFRVRLTRGNLTEVTTNIQAQSGNPAVIGGPKHGDGVLIIIVWTSAGRGSE